MDNLVYFGEAVKRLGDNRIGGFLVRYGNEQDHDIEEDYFAKSTDLGIIDGAVIPVFYNHGFDPDIKNSRIGRAQVKFKDAGVWLEAQLELREDYEKALMQLIEAGKVGWSSGAAGHLVSKTTVGKAHRIDNWPIAEASLTPMPSEPRNMAVALKSLQKSENEEDTMSLDMEELKSFIKESVTETVNTAVQEQFKGMLAKEEPIKAGVQVIGDEADRALEGNPFKGGEFFMAVKQAELYPYAMDERLKPLKAITGAGTNPPSDGGYLIPVETDTRIRENMWGVGTVMDLFNFIPIRRNTMEFFAVDETSRATGSRMGGLQSYWVAEGSTVASTKPSFKKIRLQLKKIAAMVYATDELLDDADAFGSWITTHVPTEIRFEIENAIFNGDGVGKPLGILESNALIEATRNDANEIDADDIATMWTRRYPYVTDYVWFANAAIHPQLIAMSVGNMPVYMPPGGMSSAPYGSIYGRPVYEIEYAPYLGSVGDLLLVSPSQYALINKGGVQSASSMHVKFDQFEMAFRFSYRVDGQPYWTSAVTAYDGTNTVSPFVGLAAST